MYESIPEELKPLKQWGLYQLNWQEDRQKYNKIPISALNGERAKSNDPNTWTDFETALSNLGQWKTKGLAFFFASGYVGIDIDHIDDEIEKYNLGDRTNMVSEFMDVTQSYTELSVSKSGIHIIVKAKIPGDRRRKGNVEMYQDGRFFALTGNRIDNFGVVNEANITTLYEKYLGGTNIVPLRAIKPPARNELSEFDIISRAINSKSGDTFKTLMYGDWAKIYQSQSEADLALANYLAFWTGRDFAKMDAIFRQSKLYREKFDAKRGKTTYGISLLNKAINETTEVYTSPEQNKPLYNIDLREQPKKKKLPWRSYDDTGNADRMMDLFGEKLLYSYINNSWYIYNGHFWEEDRSGYIHQYVDAMVDRIKDEGVHAASGEDKEDAEKAFTKFLKRSRQNAAKKSVIDELKHRVPTLPGDFDKDKILLNVSNGYVDLTSGELFEPDIKKMFSKQANTEYSEKYPADEWMNFLDRIFAHNQELIEYVQKAVGYSLTGSTKEQVMFILFGNGRNGKSVFLETISNILGTYANSMQAQSIMVKQYSGGPNSDIARLAGARLVTSSEPNEGLRMDEGLVKQLTGGDKVVARKLYGSEFEFEPEFKLWLATNHKPIIRGTDDGIWRRLKLIPFTVQIPDNEVDKDLKFKLARESMGIMNWMVEGAMKWQREGLTDPEIIKQSSTGYRQEMDVLAQFLDENVIEESGAEVKSSELFAEYQKWADARSEYKMSATKFGVEMSGRYERVHNRNGNVFLGIKLVQYYNVNFN